jgi:hypothetical protein
VYDSGIHAPLLIRVPKKWRTLAGGDRADELRPGSVNNDLIAFVDFAPTVLSLAGIEAPKQLQGRAFLGPQRGSAREYVFAGRDRMDERYDLIRAVRDKRFKYIRNFMPHLPYAQRIAYLELMPTMQDWRRLHAEGKLTGAAALFFRETKPVEELYDTQTDPHEVNNLADDPRYADKLKEMRGRLLQWMHETQDLGLIPEPILDEAQHPGARFETTAAPTSTAAERAADGSATLTLASPTQGASIGYRVKGDGQNTWSVYSQPIQIAADETIIAKACRIGFRDSSAVELSAESPVSSQAEPTKPASADWRPQVINDEILTRLLALKEHDRDPAKAIEAYERALSDEHPAMRYWAVVGLRIATEEKPPSEPTKTAIAQLAKRDPSDAVRMVAAHTLCRWGDIKTGLPILSTGLESSQRAVQLHAAHALEDLGEPARPLLPRLKQLAAKSSEYVQRVTAHTVEQLARGDK